MKLGDKPAWSAGELRIMKLVSQQNTKELNDTGKEKVGFRGKDI